MPLTGGIATPVCGLVRNDRWTEGPKRESKANPWAMSAPAPHHLCASAEKNKLSLRGGEADVAIPLVFCTHVRRGSTPERGSVTVPPKPGQDAADRGIATPVCGLVRNDRWTEGPKPGQEATDRGIATPVLRHWFAMTGGRNGAPLHAARRCPPVSSAARCYPPVSSAVRCCGACPSNGFQTSPPDGFQTPCLFLHNLA